MMNREDYIASLKNLGLPDRQSYYNQAFARNIGLVTEEEQVRLARARVAIPGMGGVGGIHLTTLVRAGVGCFHLADFDTFEPANVNRQYGARVPNFGRPKLECMMEEALAINPFLELIPFAQGLNAENLDQFLEGVDVVVDGLDFFEIDIRRQLFNRAWEKGIHVITAGPLGFSAALLVFSPEKGMGFDGYFDISDDMSEEEMCLNFALGLAPKATHSRYLDFSKVDFSARAGPSSIIACQICAGVAAAEALRIILGRGEVKPVPHYFQFDSYLRKYKHGYLYLGNRNPVQQLKKKIVRRMVERKQSRYGSRISQPPAGMTMEEGIMPEEIIRYLVKMGALAPSADNCQPWQFIWDGSILTLKADPARTGFFYDVNEESTLITFGAVLENIRIAASHYGLSVHYNLKSPEKNNSYLEMQFRKEGCLEDELLPFVPFRQTNRLPYSQKRIRPDQQQVLENVAKDFPDKSIYFFENKKSKKIFKQIIFEADRILFEDRRLHEGLFRWILMEKHSSRLDGMDLSVCEVKGLQRFIFPLFGKWQVLTWGNKIGMSRIPGINSVLLLNRTPLYCLLTAGRRDKAGYLESGLILERLWIQANALGFAVQPMAGFAFLLNHYFHDKAARFSERHRRMIKEINDKYNDVVGGGDGEEKYPVMFLRLGYARTPRQRSHRRELEEILSF